jgi:glycosyltransferase involved in cell wall biosynthesis
MAHVLSIHAGDVYFLARRPGGRALARFVAALTDAILADGSHVVEALDGLLTYPSDAIVQPMGVDLRRFVRTRSGRSEELSIAFVGRMVEKKGATYLLQALPHVLAKRPGVRLLLAGDGPLLEDLRAEARQLGIAGSTHFLGRVSHEEIARLLDTSRLAVVPSVVDRNGETDGMPTVVLEAMASGARVVATAVDGIPDVVRHGSNGWLCAPRDPTALGAAILEALEDTSDQIPRAARATATANSWPSVASRYAEVFTSLSTPVPGSASTLALERARGRG